MSMHIHNQSHKATLSPYFSSHPDSAAKGEGFIFSYRHSGGEKINWKEIIGMRDKIIHEYYDVDLKIVWDTIKDDLPAFKVQIKNLLR